MEQVRSFIAIELAEDIKKQLRRLQDELRRQTRCPAKWVDPDGIHLTLKFLGNVAEDRLPDISHAMQEAARDVAPFTLEVGETGAFPNLRRARVIWVGVGGDTPQLERLQRNIEGGLEPLGFAAEKRAFSPHLTLARVQDRAAPAEREELGKLLEGTDFKAGRMAVESVDLMKSQLTRQGAVYSRLCSVLLVS